MENPLEIRFTPEKEDYVKASRALASKTPMFLVLAAVVGLMAIGSLVLLIFPGIGDGRYSSIATVFLIVSVFYVIYYLALIPWQLGRSFKANEYLQKERSLVFSDDAVTMRMGDKASELDWDRFERVVETADLYLLVYKADQQIYPFVPKRAFTDSTQEATFKRVLDEKSIPLA